MADEAPYSGAGSGSLGGANFGMMFGSSFTGLSGSNTFGAPGGSGGNIVGGAGGTGNGHGLAQSILDVHSDVWNSPIARLIVPDKISISLSSSATGLVAGVSGEISLNWITRGNDANIVPYAVSTIGVHSGVGAGIDALVGVNVGYFSASDLRTLRPGLAAEGLLGYSAYGSISGGELFGGSFTGSVGFDGLPFTGSTTWLNVGVAGGLSTGGAGAAGVSYSSPIFHSQFYH